MFVRVFSGLSGVTALSLGNNTITDLSPLSALYSLRTLDLTDNDPGICCGGTNDIYALVLNCDGGGLGEGDVVDLTDVPLSSASLTTYIPYLESKGVAVVY